MTVPHMPMMNDEMLLECPFAAATKLSYITMMVCISLCASVAAQAMCMQRNYQQLRNGIQEADTSTPQTTFNQGSRGARSWTINHKSCA